MLSSTGHLIRMATVFLLWQCFPYNVRAGIGACDNLNAITTTPAVDYELEIQPIFDTYCVPCHSGPTPSAFLDLSAGYAELVDVESFEVPSFDRVQPGHIAQSYLFIKINCSNQLFGNRMPLNGNPLNLQQQALIRDWIQQLLIFADAFED